MRTSETLSTRFDSDNVEPIELDDEAIRKAVSQAELSPLLAALAMVNRDLSILDPALKPPLPPMDASIAPQGGMSAAVQEEAREVATKAIIEFRDRGTVLAEDLSEDELAVIMRFLTKDAGDDCLPLLRHELSFPIDSGAPTWNLGDVAPDVDFRVAVIGAGITGIAAAHRLSQAGVPFAVFEKNPKVGGTWYENVYPGCRLDTPNFAYSFSFAQKPDWPEQFSKQGQIENYLQTVARDFGVEEHINFETEVTSMTYLEDSNSWQLTVKDSDGIESVQVFNAVMTAVGQLNRPALPEIEGRESFQGYSFHSAQWNRDVTTGGLRIAVVGTGASAYQIVPSVTPSAKSVTVFQRNAPWMLPTPNYHNETTEGMLWLLTHLPFYGRWVRFWQFWLASEGRMPFVQADANWENELSTSEGNEHLRRQLVESIERQVEGHPDLLEKMIPNYPPGSKRMLRDNGAWVSSLKQPHVELVTDPISRVTPTGIVTEEGTEREFDLIVYATGFQASDYLAPMQVTGRDGKDLHEYWGGDARAYMGVNVPGFPNMFMLMGPNTGVVVNGSSLFMGECTAEYSVATIGEMLATGAQAIEATQAATDEFVAYVDAGNKTKAWGVSKVQTWYRNSHGRASQVWPYSLREYYDAAHYLNLDAYQFLGGTVDEKNGEAA